MKIRCNTQDLINGINIVQKAVSSKTTMPILKGIMLKANSNKLTLTGNDLNIGIENHVETEIETEGSIVVSSKLFGEIIRKLPDETVEIFVDENNTVHINCNYSKFELIGQATDEFPSLPEVDDSDSISINRELLKNMIRQTIFATATGDTRPILTGTLMKIEDGIISMVSLDGYRLAIRMANIVGTENKSAIIPAKTLSEVSKIISSIEDSGDININISDKHIMFNFDDIKIVSRLLEGEFIKYSQMIPKEYKSKVVVSTNQLLKSIERASLVAREGRNTSIKISISDDFMNISSNVEIGSVNEDVKINLEGDDLIIGFNPKYLSDALKVIDSEEVVLELSSSVSPCIIKPLDNENYIYLVSAVRIPKQ